MVYVTRQMTVQMTFHDATALFLARHLTYNGATAHTRRGSRADMAAETWRQLLGQLVPTPSARRKLSQEHQIGLRTLERWISGETEEPNFALLERLLEAFPVQRDRLVLLIQKEFPGFHPLIQADQQSGRIPATFYARILESYTHVAEPLRFWTITNLIFEQMLPILDAENRGIEIVIVQATRPMPGRPVRSLYENVGTGTTPWPQTLASRTLFLGAESLAGYVVSTAQPAVVQASEPTSRIPVTWTAHEMAAAALPLQIGGRIAGCLLVSSTQADFFTPAVQQALHHYSNLLTLAFAPADFYDLSAIALARMPEPSQQQSLLGYFPRRVSTLMAEQGISRQVAEERTRQEMEDELLRQRADTETETSNHDAF
jgi:hypothetical protein